MALSPKQEQYSVERAAGASQKDAAHTVGVAENTGWRWEQLPEVADRIDALRDEIVADALRYLKSHTLRTARRLVELTQPGRTGMTGATNLAACKDILDRVGLKPVERRETTHIIQRRAEELARELGLDVADVLAEAERIVRAGA